MAAEKKRIGLVLASIHTGMALNMWPNFARTAAASNAGLFIFPGGRLDVRQDFEYLRNSVYNLANEDNLDACISWSSSIRYNQPQEEFEHFHAAFEPLPYLTIGYKIPGHPCVKFDAYKGVKALVTHCIQSHGAKKIAFLCGPGMHLSAQARLEGYKDALKEAGIRYDPSVNLITDPFNWNEGAAAAAQLFESRSLVPGKDFDTLAGSSDLMVLGAINYFARRGYHVPADYRAVGFNNSEESCVAESPLSTVHLPYAELAHESFKMLFSIMGKKNQHNVNDINLDPQIVIRESCGCVDRGIKEQLPKRHKKGAYSKEALAKMIKDYIKPDTATMNTMILPLLDAFLEYPLERFLPLFQKALISFLKSNKEPESLIRLISDMTMGMPEKIRRLEPAIYRSIFRVQEQLNARDRYEKATWNTALNSLKCDLLGTRERFSLIQSLAYHLPKVGVNTAAIVLYDDEKTSIFVGGFSGKGISPVKEQRFPARLLVPAALRSQYNDGVFMVQPLFIENHSLGYFVHNVSINDGLLIEDLRSSISYALKGMSLLEETIRAKKLAEKLDRAKTEFLKALDSDLYNVMEEFSLHKTIFDIEDLLSGLGTFPLMSGDTAHLAQCFSIIHKLYLPHSPSPYFEGDSRLSTKYCSAKLTYAGLSITFRRANTEQKDSETGKARKKRKLSLALVERIIMMHGGNFYADRDRLTVTLPWPTLTGQEPSQNPVSPQDHVLVLSDPSFLPGNFFKLPKIQDVDKALPGKTAFITWNATEASSEEFIKVASLRHKKEFAGIPFLCYGKLKGIDSAASFISAVELSLKSSRKETVLFIGFHEYRDDSLETFLSHQETRLEKIRIDSVSEFNETIGEIKPSLIIFDTIDPAGAEAVRRHPLAVMVPIIMLSYRINNHSDVRTLSKYSRLLICHRTIASSAEFQARILALLEGDEILPLHTGVLVKKAILYFDQHAKSHISRWKLADFISVSEDYLTRIFHKEMGLSMWDYLNRLRVYIAADLLRQSDQTIQEIAANTGFRTQAYFCRVFKKIYGAPPGQLRKEQQLTT